MHHGIYEIPPFCVKYYYSYIQLFRERLWEKVHATIPKGIVGCFKFPVLQRNLKELARKKQCIDHIPYYLSGLSRAHFF